MSVTLNLTDEEAAAVWVEIERQFDAAGREYCQDLVPVHEKLKPHREKFQNA